MTKRSIAVAVKPAVRNGRPRLGRKNASRDAGLCRLKIMSTQASQARLPARGPTQGHLLGSKTTPMHHHHLSTMPMTWLHPLLRLMRRKSGVQLAEPGAKPNTPKLARNTMKSVVEEGVVRREIESGTVVTVIGNGNGIITESVNVATAPMVATVAAIADAILHSWIPRQGAVGGRNSRGCNVSSSAVHSCVT